MLEKWEIFFFWLAGIWSLYLIDIADDGASGSIADIRLYG